MLSKHFTRVTYRGALVALLVTNFAGRFLETNGLFYATCSMVFMSALFEVARWSVVIDRDERVPPGLAALTTAPAWLAFVLGLLALWMLVSPSTGSPYAAWWSYRSSNVAGLYLWNATFVAYGAFAVVRALLFVSRYFLHAYAEARYGSQGGGYSSPYCESRDPAAKAAAAPRPTVRLDKLHGVVATVGLATLGTLAVYWATASLGFKYPDEVQNHVGVFATIYGAIGILRGLIRMEGG